MRLDRLLIKKFQSRFVVFLNSYEGLAPKENKSTRRNWITTGVDETEVWVRFLAALSCFVSCKVGDAYLVAHQFTFFCSNFVVLFDAGGQSHNTVYPLPRFMLGIYCMTVSRSCKGKRVLPNPRHKRLQHINNLCKRRLGTIMLRLQSDLQSRYFLWPMHQSCSSSNLQALFLTSI